MGVADHLPDPPIRLGKADHGQRVVLIPFRDVDGHTFVEPVVPADHVRHPTESLENNIAILSDQKLVELLGGVGGGTVVAVLGQGFVTPENQNHEKDREEANHPCLSSELCGKAPASP